jgi:hypothetical protein
MLLVFVKESYGRTSVDLAALPGIINQDTLPGDKSGLR